MIEKLVRGLLRIESASKDQLRSRAWMRHLLEAVGLAYDYRGIYGEDECFANRGDGLYQVPQQLADFLVWLSREKVSSFVEVGTWSGWTAAVVATYLRAFNDGVRAVAVDIRPQPGAAEALQAGGVELRVGTVEAVRGMDFDLALIDGDHRYPCVRLDFESLYRPGGKLIAFHDIQDQLVIDDPAMEGGPPRFWRELRTRYAPPDAAEFLHHAAPAPLMGIGVVRTRA